LRSCNNVKTGNDLPQTARRRSRQMYRSVRRSGRCNRQTRNWVARTFPFFTLALAICFIAPRAACATSAPSSAAAPRAVQSGRGGGYQQRRSRKSSIDVRVARISGRLNLNESQRVELKKLLERQQVESKRLWNDQGIAPMDRMTKLRVLQEDTQKKFHALLTEEQRKKYDQLLQPASGQNPPQENEKDAH
jgi:hypothetical protein